MQIAITSIGTANPTYKRSQHDAAELIAEELNLKPSEKRLLKAIYKASGIENRYSVLGDYCKKRGEFDFFPNEVDAPFPPTSARMRIYKENALPLAITAVESCLANLPTLKKSDITHLITISCTGMYAPGLDIELVQQLHFNSTTKRIAINFMGCYGAFNGIKTAESICRADPNAKVLIVSVELCTIHFQKNSNMDNMVSNAIFADGAAAIVVEANPNKNKYFSLEAFHCDLLPQTNQQMAWQISDSGFDIVLSSYVPDTIKSGISAFTQKLLDHLQLTFSAIDFFAIHPGGVKILQACEKSLDITAEQNKYSYQVLKDYGNMSSATVLFVLKSIWDDIDKKHHNKNIFSCAFGPGLTLESMLLRAHHS